jgi:4-hydroxybenzoate polyprenyltransferase
MGFAFLTSFIREIMKDVEDIKGDSRFGCRTFAVVFGEQKARFLVLILAFMVLVGLVWVQILFYDLQFWQLFGYFFLVDAVFLVIILLLFRAKEVSEYGRLSNLMKIFMLLGVFSMLLFYFI